MNDTTEIIKEKEDHRLPSCLRMKTNGAAVESAGIFVPDKGTHWSMQRSVPRLIRDTKRIQEMQEKSASRPVRTKVVKPEPPRNLIIKPRPEGGYDLIGFGKTVKTLQEAKEFAKANNRKKVIKAHE